MCSVGLFFLFFCLFFGVSCFEAAAFPRLCCIQFCSPVSIGALEGFVRAYLTVHFCTVPLLCF